MERHFVPALGGTPLQKLGGAALTAFYARQPSGGVHPKVVSERLGHATITITLDIYSHVTPALGEEVAAKVAAMVVPV